jgi:hypothetical protein
MIFFTILGVIVLAGYILVGIAWTIYAYAHLNPNHVSPRPTRRKGKRMYFWPLRPVASIIEGLIWPFSVARLTWGEMR